MKHLVLAAIALVALAAATPAPAADCPYEAQTCLDYLAKMRNRGYAGVDLDTLGDDRQWTVTKVYAGTPAAEAGIRIGDVLLSIDDIRLGDEKGMLELEKIMKPGNTVGFKILRDGGERTFRLELMLMPDDVFARFVGEHMLQHVTD